ncbi:hypothetical protein [Streptomyces malaysiensis]|uniref:Uncharacterized protein n=1 Tax=Streptomyces malaysiensis TaxID=92644 RepID=A0A7X6B2T9_STRMQ|nr:hypothetical protein [Streptomyces malaysiensis]NIY70777.1 hypothetical protein [Streptomyces malaysiensis]
MGQVNLSPDRAADPTGDLIGVKPIDKDRLVTKMSTTLDPPWWTPEVISVAVDGKLLLVVRVAADTAPRPLLNQGAIRIRLDGANNVADRRLAQVLFQQMDQAPSPAYTSYPRFAPDSGAIENRERYRAEPTDLVIRAATELPLRLGPAADAEPPQDHVELVPRPPRQRPQWRAWACTTCSSLTRLIFIGLEKRYPSPRR